MKQSVKNHIKVPELLFAAALFFTMLYLPILDDQQPQRALALLLFVAFLWVTEAIPLALTGLLVPLLAVFLKLSGTVDAFRQFSHPIIFLFMGGFTLAGALSHHSLDKLISQKLIGLAKGNFYKSAILLMLATSLTACWVTNTSAAAMMIPLALGMLGISKKDKVSAESKFLMLGIAYSANIGGILTMVASPPNAMGAAILGLSFSKWSSYTVPFFLIAFPMMVTVLTLCFKPDRKITISSAISDTDTIRPNKTLIWIFALIVLLWATDSLLAPILGITDNFSSLVALFALFLLFVTRVMTWENILKSIRWSILLLFGGGLTLGMIIDSSGLGLLLVSKVATLAEFVPLWLFLWFVVVFGIVLTEFMSNTASAALILPLLFTMAVQMKIDPMMLVFPATIAASFGFMMPVGTPPNAMVFATGLIPRTSMLTAGLIINLLSSVVITAYFYFIFS